MSPLNPFFAILVFFISYFTTYLFNIIDKKKVDESRFETIDGLRGFLAVGVFIHHSCVWFHYLQTNTWKTPESNLYNLLGQASVSLFFMITAFLFTTKILKTNGEKINWLDLYISRLFRLVPMYLLSITAVIIIIFIISDWVLKVSLSRLLIELFCWITFTVIYNPTINDYQQTNLINSGIVWSLSYEWFFYASLPILFVLFFKKRTSLLYMTISILFVVAYFMIHNINYHHLLSFAGGILPPFIIKYNSKKTKYNSNIYNLIIFLCLFLILFFKSTDNYTSKILLIIVFNLIAFGNDFFGILKSSRLKLLGDISYGIYLIHGITIFIVMSFYFKFDQAKQLSSTNFCITIFTITPIIVIISYLTHKYIEMPFINYSKKNKRTKTSNIP